MKKTMILLVLLIVIGASSAAWYPQKVNVPVTNYDNITLVDDKYMFFGTGADAAISYDSSEDKLYINDTPIYLEEAVTLGAGFTGGAITASGTIQGEQLTSTDDALVYGTFTSNDVVSNTTVAAADITASDDAVITDDLTVDGGARIDETLTVNTAKINGTTYSVGALNTDALATVGNLKSNATGYFVTTLNSGGAATVNQLLSNTTGSFHGGIIGDSYASIGGSVTANSAKVNTTLDVADDVDIDGTLQVGGASDFKDIDINDTLDVDNGANFGGAVAVGGTMTLNSSQALAVTTADMLTVGGVIIPQEIILITPITKTDFTAGELNRSIFIADDAWTITSIEEVHNVAESTATTMVLSVQKLTGTQALNAGINITNGDISLKGAANTVQAATLSTTAGRTTLADGDRVGILCNLTGTNAMSEFRGGVLTIHMKRV